MKKTASKSKDAMTKKEYNLIVKGFKKEKNSIGTFQSIDWKKGENFTFFSLLKNVQSGATSTDSCLTSNY
jgi:hypothetical protein